jgi:hypothetical protein
MKAVLLLAIACSAGEWRQVPEDTVIDNLCYAIQTVKKDTVINDKKVRMITVKKMIEANIKMIKIEGKWYTK